MSSSTKRPVDDLYDQDADQQQQQQQQHSFQPSKRASYSPPGGDGYLSTGSPTPSPTLALSPFDHPNKLATTASEAASASHPAMDVSSVAISKDEGDSPNGNGMNSASSPTGSASGLMMPGDQNLIPQISIRALIPVKAVGSIIGRNGTVIQAFREKTGAKINVSENIPGTIERILTITGPVLGVSEAFLLVAKRLEDEAALAIAAGATEGSVGTAAAAAAASPISPPGTLRSTVDTLRLLVPNSQVGSIIGKAGAKIKEMQELTGARVSVSESVLPASTERALSLSGTAEAVHKAVFDVCQKMMENPARVTTIPYRPIQTGTTPVPQNIQPNVYVTGPPPPRNVQGGYSSQMPMYPQPTAQMAIPSQPMQFRIASEMVGCIIGKGGSRISDIRKRSGSQIKIEDAIPGSNERIITLLGTPETNQAAIFWINYYMQAEVTPPPAAHHR